MVLARLPAALNHPLGTAIPGAGEAGQPQIILQATWKEEEQKRPYYAILI